MRVLVAAVVVGGLVTSGAAGWHVRAQSAAPAQATTPQSYTFPSGAGLLFFYVRPDRAADFETVIKRLGEVLSGSQDPVRQQQASSWRMFRSVESHNDRIYVFMFDPAVSGADYDPVKILNDALPAEVQDLYAKLKGAIVKVERMGLDRMR
jgi:hypothetical protein